MRTQSFGLRSHPCVTWPEIEKSDVRQWCRCLSSKTLWSCIYIQIHMFDNKGDIKILYFQLWPHFWIPWPESKKIEDSAILYWSPLLNAVTETAVLSSEFASNMFASTFWEQTPEPFNDRSDISTHFMRAFRRNDLKIAKYEKIVHEVHYLSMTLSMFGRWYKCRFNHSGIVQIRPSTRKRDAIIRREDNQRIVDDSSSG